MKNANFDLMKFDLLIISLLEDLNKKTKLCNENLSTSCY